MAQRLAGQRGHVEILRQKYHHPRNDDLGDEDDIDGDDDDGDDNESLENEGEYHDGDERGERG